MNFKLLEEAIDIAEKNISRYEIRMKEAKNEWGEAYMEGLLDGEENNLCILKKILNQMKSEYSSEKEKRIEESWRNNPDRMGGQYTDQEILDSYSWEGMGR